VVPFASFARRVVRVVRVVRVASDFDCDFWFRPTAPIRSFVRSTSHAAADGTDGQTVRRSSVVGQTVACARAKETEEIESDRQSWGRTCPNRSRRRIRRTARRARTRTERRRCRDGERTWRCGARMRWCLVFLFFFWLLERAKPKGAGVDLGFVDDQCSPVQSARAVFRVWLIELRRLLRRRLERGTRREMRMM